MVGHDENNPQASSMKRRLPKWPQLEEALFHAVACHLSLLFP